MNKKRMFIPFIIVGILLSIASIIIGYSMWVVSDSVTKELKDNTKEIVYTIHNNQEVIYDGTIQLPSHIIFGVTDETLFSYEDIIEYKYKKESETTYNTITRLQLSQTISYNSNSTLPIPGPYDVGTYNIQIVYDKDRTNNVVRETTDTITFKILPRPIEITWSNTELEYNGFNQSPTLTINNLVDGDTCNVTLSQNECKNAGTYNIAVTYVDNTNYTIVGGTNLNTEFSITKKSINNATVYLSEYNYICDGTAKTPSITSIKVGSLTLTESDYDIEYTNNINVTNNAQVIITGKGNFKDSITVTFNIVNPSLNDATVILSQDSYTYDGTAKTPSISSINIGELTLSNDDYTVSYSDNTNASNNAKVVITGNGSFSGSKTVYFTINKANVEVQDIELSYTSNIRTWEEISPLLKDNVIVKDTTTQNNISVAADQITIVGMHNGVFKYGTVNTNETLKTHSLSVVGSTYKLYISINNSNINITNKENNYALVKFKYKTVTNQVATDANPENSLTYYTIEDALGLNTTIYLAGAQTQNNNNNNNNFVYTSFSALTPSFTGYNATNTSYNSNNFYTYNLNSKLRLPFNSADLDYHGAGGKTKAVEGFSNTETIHVDAYNLVYSSLYIPSNVRLNITNSNELIVGGLIQHTGTTQNRAVLFNDGLINLQSSAKLKSFGYTKGTGTIVNNSGCTISDVFKAHDWRNAGSAKGYKDADIFPINQFSCHNVSCEVIINAGSSYDCFWTFELGSIDTYQRSDMGGNSNIVMVGANGLFNLSSGYILKNATGGRETIQSLQNEIDNLTGSNQMVGQKDKIDIYGTCIDSKVTMSLRVPIVGSYTIETGPNLGLPIAYMDISVKDNSNLTMKTSTYLFMPGSSLTVEPGGILNIGDGSTQNSLVFLSVSEAIDYYQNFRIPFITSTGGNCKERIDALFKVQGTLNLKNNAKLGAMVIAEGNTGHLNLLNSPQTTLRIVTKIEDGLLGDNVSCIERNFKSRGFFPSINNTIIRQDLANGEYFSRENYWYGTQCILTFDANGGVFSNGSSQITSEPYNTDASGFILQSIPNIVTTPSRTNYTFDGWYVDIQNNKQAVGSTFYASSNIYAKWIPNTYTITYNFNNYHEDVPEALPNYIFNNNPDSYNYETQTFNLNAAEYDDYIFDGWYTDAEYTNAISAIDGTMARDLTLYGMWHPKNTPTYIINVWDYNPELNTRNYYRINQINILSSKLNTYSSVTDMLPVKTDKDNNKEYPYYFNKWYINEDCSIEFTTFENIGVTDENNNVIINVYSNYLDKTKYTYKISLETGTTTLERETIVYYKPGINTILGKEHLPNELREYVGSHEFVWFNSLEKNNSQYLIGSTNVDIDNINKVLYGDLYYIVTDLNAPIPEGVKHYLFKGTNLNDIEISIYNANMSTYEYTSKFSGIGIKKLILDGVTLRNGVKETKSEGGGCGGTTTYSHWFVGSFSHNNISQVIFRNITNLSNENAKYMFSNNTVSKINAYGDVSINLNDSLYKDQKQVENKDPTPPSTLNIVQKLSSEKTFANYTLPNVLIGIIVSIAIFVAAYIIIKIRKNKHYTKK